MSKDTEGLNKLKTGDFNFMHQKKQPDGSTIITLTSGSWTGSYTFRVKGLYTDKEVLLDVTTGKSLNP